MRQSPVILSSSLPSVGTSSSSASSSSASSSSAGSSSAGSSSAGITEQVRFAVHGRWVLGTLDRVVLERQDATGSLEVNHHRVHQLFGRGAMDPLYLTGKSKFECSLEDWVALRG
jgi:hypothetical protein